MKEIKIVKEETKTKYTFKCLNYYLGSIIRLRLSSAIHIGVLASASDDEFAIQHIPYNNTGHYQTVFTATKIAEWLKHPYTGITIYNAKKDEIKRAKLHEIVDGNITKSREFDTSVIKPSMNILVVKDEAEKGYVSDFHVLDVGKDLIKCTTYDENIFDKTIYKKKLSKGGYYIEATPEQLADERYSYHYEEKCADRKTVTMFDHYFETGDGYFDATTAFKYLIDGKKVRQVDWTPDEYIKLCRYRDSIIDESNEDVNQNIIIAGRDAKWELFKEVTEDALR